MRLRNNLSQDALARLLGLKGGKSVISGWENGHTTCEGPAAELLLRLFPEDPAASEVTSLLAEAESLWKRAVNYVDTWRQIVAVPCAPVQIEQSVFDGLFPGTEIPPPGVKHGFPFLNHDLPADVYRKGPREWTGLIPWVATRPPAYLWILKRDGRFVYREHIWEDAPTSVTKGHIHIGSLLQLALSGTFFLQRLFTRCRLDPELEYTLQLDQHGIHGRGFVGYRQDRHYPDLTLDEPGSLAGENHLSATIRCAVSSIESKPLLPGMALVGELARLLRPDLATAPVLENQLRRRHLELGRSGNLFLGFLDPILGAATRRGIVSISGTRVGVLEETAIGARFSYDRAYLRRPGAVAISPTIPLDDKPYDSLGLHPFFANLLPEGSRLDVVSKKLNVDRNDRFAVLLAAGADSIGAVEVRPDPDPLP